ncbi:MAG: hypothetical protein HOP19_28475 [Acidobacteria bacterium]|nr:hypothetical protein [Acidobacteriota bacterium]
MSENDKLTPSNEKPAESDASLEPEILERIPPEVRREVNQFTAIMGSFANAGQPPYLKKNQRSSHRQTDSVF